MGGTELIATTLADRLDPDLLKEFQIVHSRVRELDETKIRIWVAHDLPGDPESEFLHNEGWKKFHKLVFVSNWQMQAYINHYGIPWNHCVVIQNAIDPIEDHEKPDDGIIRLGYWSTPHRGLNILYPVFNKLCEDYDNLELDVYSSFGLYGWEERDEPYKDLFEACEKHDKINYHGAVENEKIREAVKNMHILAYPSIWQETSCLVLMEAMSAGLLCVHPNLGALHETAANWTYMYQWDERPNNHAGLFYNMMRSAIDNLNKDNEQRLLASMKSYANIFYSWAGRLGVWQNFLLSMVNANPPRELEKAGDFVYRID